MTHGSPESGTDKSSNVFILSKRSTPARPSPQVQLSARLHESTRQIFPEALLGDTFNQRVAEITAEDRVFAAMALQFDELDSNDPNPPVLQANEPLIRALEAACMSHQGLWGLMTPLTYGCLLRHTDAQGCRAIAAEIQQHTAAAAGTALTIGIAEFPTLDYGRDQVVDNALKALEHAKFLGPQALVVLDAVSLNISGDRLYDEGRLDDAVAEFKNALLLDGSNPNVHNSLGVCYAIMDDLDHALERFETALALDASEPYAFYNAGLAHKMRGNRAEALDRLSTAHRLDPGLFEAALQIGCLYNEMAQPDRAEAVLRKSIRLNPHSAAAHTQLGESQAALNRPEDAISAFKTAIKKNANDAAALSGLGWLYFLRGENPDIARLFCEQSVELEPGDGRFHFRLGRIHLANERYRDALIRFENAQNLGHDTEGYIEQTRARLNEEADEDEGHHQRNSGRQHCG